LGLQANRTLHAAEIPAAFAGEESPTDAKVTSAAEIQLMFYEGLVKRGVPAGVAALITADTEILSEDASHIHFVQTMIGEGKRDVEIAFKAAEPGTTERVAMTLDDGRVALAETIDVSGPADGYRANAAIIIPAESVPAELQKPPELGQERRGWLEWIGIRNALAQATGSGLAATFSDAFSSSGSTSTSGSGMQSLVRGAEQAFSGQTIDFVKTASDVASAIEPRVEGPKTQWQHRTDMVKAGAKVFEHGAKVYKTLKEDDAMRQRLRALKDCAENPTEPTARDAQRNDPNYRRATTEVIEDAERNLKLNTTIRVVASTNSHRLRAAGFRKIKTGVLLGKLEDKLLQHVAKYIMKDAGKVVPASRIADSLLASAAHQRMYRGRNGCEQPCDSWSARPRPPATLRVPRDLPPPPAETCGVLTRAQFTYLRWSIPAARRLAVNQYCRRFYAGSAATPGRNCGIPGQGTGHYRNQPYGGDRAGPCSWSRSSGQTAGRPT
jgi:hypothetical protein